ncbi:MAG: hypothetical protein AAFZ07_10925 [Actinomycetota bacterium]
MRTLTTDPIPFEWSTSATPTATTQQLALALARHDVDELEAWNAELWSAVTELSLAAGRPWSFDRDEPTIALLRAAAVLAGRHPDVSGTSAAVLVAALGG